MVRAAAVEAPRPGCVAVLERDRERDAVGTAIAMLRAGRGGAILVEGEAGIGKTALIDAALGALGSQGAGGGELEAARATCDEWSRHFAFSAITAALDLDPRRSGVAQDALLAVMDELVDQVRQRCEQGPLVLVIEDLQWADDASLSVWRELCGHSANLPLLVLGSLRPGNRPTLTAKLRRDMAGCGGVILELGPLSETATIAMAAELLGASPGPGLRKLLGSAAGVPRHIAELVSLVSRFGMLSDGDGGEVEVADSWADLGGPDLAVGWSKAIAARLGGVAPGALDVLRGAAVAGEEFSEFDLARLLCRPYERLSAELGELVQAGLLTRAGSGLRFRHVLIRHAVYESLPVALRSALHHHLARLLVGTEAPPERIARHLLVGGQEPEPWEVDWLIENVDALADREPSTAVGMIEKVLADDGAADPRFTSLHGRLARIHLGLENYEQAEAHARSVLQRGGDAGAVGSATWTAGLSLLYLHRPDQALCLLEATAANPPAAWRARYAALRALAHHLAGRLDEAAHAAQEALVGGRAGDQVAVCCALYVRSAVRAVRSDTASAVADVEEALPIAGSLPELVGLRVLLLGNQFIYRFAAGMHEGAVDAVRHALTVAVRLDSPWQLRLRRQAADLLYDLGLWEEAMQCLRGWRDPMEYAVAALIALHRDELPEALRNITELERVVADTDVEHEGYSPFLYLAAVRAQHAARFGKPLGPVLAELEVCTAPGAEDRLPQRHRVLPVVAALALHAGDTRVATAAADAAVRDAQADPTPRKRAEADVCEGLVRAEPERLLRAAEYFREAGLRLYAGLAREYAAELLASAGDMPGARSAMNDARAVYEAAGARWDARRAVARLRDFDVRLGARGPRSRPAVGAGALTPTERQVAEFLAQGCPNPEIATRLCVSRRTVETHVSKILAKLQISSRRQVREHLFASEAGEPVPHSGN
jgi:DNA-binding CsgD family transcriptional regulator/tetratricopeptide (TPR) repeat protein